MQDDVRHFCAACLECKRAKTPIASRFGLLQSFERDLPNNFIALDFLTFKSKRSRGPNDEQHILVMYDTFSHFLVARAMKTRALESVCDTIIRHLIACALWRTEVLHSRQRISQTRIPCSHGHAEKQSKLY